MSEPSTSARTPASAGSPRPLSRHGSPERSRLLGWLALVAVYFLWGSTYAAIRVGVATFPPFILASVRYLIAGGILFAFTYRSGASSGGIRWVHWKSAAVVGLLMLAGANGLLTVSERVLASNLAALIVATVPLWLVLLDALVQRTRIRPVVLVGLAVGFLGTAILVNPLAAGHPDLGAVGLLILSPICWAAGSIYSRGADMPSDPLLSSGMEMLAGGAILGLIALGAGETQGVHLTHDALLAIAWLTVAGSLIGFSSYIYAFKVLPTSTVSTYAFVNPIVAVGLGWWLLGEAVTPRMLVAMSIITGAVVLILAAPRKRWLPQ